MPGAGGKKIGGFLGLDLPLAQPAGRSAWQVMTEGAVEVHHGRTARSVLAAMLRALSPNRIWYPAYFCPEAALTRDTAERMFFPVGPRLRPDADWLASRLRPQDAVLAVNYFGQPTPDDFRALTRARPDVFWIEDCAQGLSPGAPWGDWRLFSPRKLFGVPDGGLGTCLNPAKQLGIAQAADPKGHFSEPEALSPLLWRLEDETETLNDIWYAAYLKSEARFCSGTSGREQAGISGLSQRLLQAIDADAAMDRRHANAHMLYDLIPQDVSFWDAPPAAAPLGVPILLNRRDRAADDLAAQGIFCPVHWRCLPSEARGFPQEHHLAASMLTLPCDQRYGPREMERIAGALRALGGHLPPTGDRNGPARR